MAMHVSFFLCMDIETHFVLFLSSDDYLKFACEMVGDYLNQDLFREISAVYKYVSIHTLPIQGNPPKDDPYNQDTPIVIQT